MISILNRRLITCFVGVVALCLGVGSTAGAQSSQTISVSPTLFDITADKGQVWQSELRIINPNSYDLVVYPQVVNFNSSGESGQPRFEEIISLETDGQTFGEWITISDGPIVVSEQQAATVPFSVIVPNDAAPGGHYAAILIGTRPPSTNSEMGTGVQTSQFVTALLFLRVDGDINESARIRNFTTNQNIYQTPDVNLSLRFENIGNVHVQPQGTITITNMWGEERGAIPINQRTQFGKVLRDSVREFSFNWKGNLSFFDIGRYKAELTLAYGNENKQFVSSQTYFWVIPITSILLVFGSIGLFVMLLVLAVRSYVRRMLLLAGVNPDTGQRYTKPDPGTIVIGRYQRATAPFRNSLVDLKREIGRGQNISDRSLLLIKKLWHDYSRIIIGSLLFIVTCSILIIFRWAVTESEREFEVTIFNDDNSARTLTSEQIVYDSLPIQTEVYLREIRDYEKVITVNVVNVSGELGSGAKIARQLEAYGLTVSKLSSDFAHKQSRSVIIYRPGYQDIALALSRELEGLLVSARNGAGGESLEIRVGSDMIK